MNIHDFTDINIEQNQEDLTLVLLYLSFQNNPDRGKTQSLVRLNGVHNIEVLAALEAKELIRYHQGSRMIELLEEGQQKAEVLVTKMFAK